MVSGQYSETCLLLTDLPLTDLLITDYFLKNIPAVAIPFGEVEQRIWEVVAQGFDGEVVGGAGVGEGQANGRLHQRFLQFAVWGG